MKPVVLMIPGSLNDEEVWKDVADLLSARADVRIANVGHASDMAAMAGLAWRAVQDVAPDRALVLAGFSMGGYVAIEMLAHPVRSVHAVALVSTSARPETDESRAKREKSILAFQGDFVKTVEGVVQWCTYQPSEPLKARLRAMMMRVGPDVAVRQTKAIAARHDHRLTLGALELPVVVVCGAQDKITPPALSEELAGLIPHAQLSLVPECGHMLPLEKPDFLASCLQRILD